MATAPSMASGKVQPSKSPSSSSPKPLIYSAWSPLGFLAITFFTCYFTPFYLESSYRPHHRYDPERDKRAFDNDHVGISYERMVNGATIATNLIYYTIKTKKRYHNE